MHKTCPPSRLWPSLFPSLLPPPLIPPLPYPPYFLGSSWVLSPVTRASSFDASRTSTSVVVGCSPCARESAYLANGALSSCPLALATTDHGMHPVLRNDDDVTMGDDIRRDDKQI